MARIFSEIELIDFNEKMLGRGMPIEEDGIGYNKADYGACAIYYYGLSNAQYADLAKRLIKYSKTQLGIDRADMVATESHYKEIAEKEDKKHGISVKVEDGNVMLSFKYNETFINVVRKLPVRSYIKDMKCWSVPINKSVDALIELEKAGADVKNSINYIESLLIKGWS